MTTEAWLAFAATATVILILPHPLAALTSAYVIGRGRLTAILILPCYVLSICATGAIAAGLAMAIRDLVPSLVKPLAWAALSYLVIYVLYAVQHVRRSQRTADNDNLPATRPAGIIASVLRVTIRHRRYLAVLTALCLQLGEEGPWPTHYVAVLAALALAAAMSALFYTALPRFFQRRHHRAKRRLQAPHKQGTLFIASRAVTAGYRRIAA